MNERLQVIIEANCDKLKTGIKQAEKALDGLDNKSNGALSKLKGGFSKAGSAVGAAAGVMVKGVAAAAAGMAALVFGTEETQEALNKVSAAFTSNGQTVEQGKKVWSEFYGILGEDDTAAEASQLLANMTSNVKDQQSWVDICKGTYIAFGDSLPTESLIESANETAKVGTVTGTLADALNWAGISEDEFNSKLAACSSEAERQKLIQDTLTQTYKDQTAQYDATNGKLDAQRQAMGNLKAATADLGATLSPIVTAAMGALTSLIEYIQPHIEAFMNNHMPGIQAACSNAWSVIQPIIEGAIGIVSNIWSAVQPLIAVIIDNMPAIGSAFSAVWTIIEPILNTAIEILGVVCQVVGTAIGTIINAIESAIAYFTYLGEGFSNTGALISDVWDKITGKSSKSWGQIASDSKARGAETEQNFNTTMDNIWSKADKTGTDTESKLGKSFEGISSKAATNADKINGSVAGIASTAESKTAKVNDSLFLSGTKFDAMAVKVDSATGKAKSSISGKFGDMSSSVKENMATMNSTTNSQMAAMNKTVANKINATSKDFKSGINSMRNTTKFSWSLPHLRMPHLSISGSFSINPPSVPHFSIDWYAKAMQNPMILNGATIFGAMGGKLLGGGESGKEVVSGLDTLQNMFKDIMQQYQQPTTIILKLKETELGKVTIDAINSITRQTGELQLNLS